VPTRDSCTPANGISGRIPSARIRASDEIVARLANTLNAQLIEAEARRAERSVHPDAVDLYFQGIAHLNKGVTLEHLTQARGFFERALALDPGSIEALVGTAMVDYSMGVNFFTDERDTSLATAETALNKALSMAPQHAQAHMYLGAWYIFSHSARPKGLPNASARRRWIETWLRLMAGSVAASFILVVLRKPRPTSMRRSASHLAIPLLTGG